MPLDENNPDFWTEALQFTPTIHRDVYPGIDPTGDKLQRIARDKVVIVTGAGSGFGKGACQQWARAGAEAIILSARSRTTIEQVADTLRATTTMTSFHAIPTDVSSPPQVEALFEKALAQFGRVDVVVHCAGVLGPVKILGDAPVEAWSSAFDVNLKGTFLVARALARASRGAPVSFIHAGTAASYFASSGQSAYTASKAASNMLLEQLHAEYENICVFNVHPGMIKSPVLRPELEIYARDTPELFGSFTVYLAGTQAGFLRGCFVAANWDVDELERYQAEIVEQGLLRGQPFKGTIGSGGHAFADRA